MKSFKDISRKETDLEEACWVGYKKVGMKKKGDKMVPNCVKEEVVDDLFGKDYIYESIADMYKGSFSKDQLAKMKKTWSTKKASDVTPSVKNFVKGLDQFTQMDISGAQQNNGPALQFPAGFQPNAPVRTVASGGNVNTSRPAVPVVTLKPAVQRKFSERELRGYMDEIMMKHSNNAALNSNHDMLPFARVNASGTRTDQE